MSYVVYIWEQPADLPIPDEIQAIDKMVTQLRKTAAGRNPKFDELAKQLAARYPVASGEAADDANEADVWLEGLDVPGNNFVWNLALNSHSDKLDEVQAVIGALATDLGLNMEDEQGGDAYLFDGRVISRRPAARCMRATAAYAIKDFPNAWQLFMEQANRGNRHAMESLAMMAVRGEGVPRAKIVAHALFMRANNSTEADRLGRYMDAAELEAAGQLLTELRENTIASTAIETELQRTADTASGRYRILAGAKLEPPPAEFAKDLSAVPLESLQQDAKGGDRHARYELGRRFKAGAGVPQDDRLAAQWWLAAAMDNIVDAQYRLAMITLTGEGVVKDVTRAFLFFGRAADNGHADAVCKFGDMHAKGEGTVRDSIAAKALYLYARKNGSTLVPKVEFAAGETAEVTKLLAIIHADRNVTTSIARWRAARHPAANAGVSESGRFAALRDAPDTRAHYSEEPVEKKDTSSSGIMESLKNLFRK
jgi:TPR repeat protein